MISKEELLIYINLLYDLYGEDYCRNYSELSELIKIEFDLEITPEKIALILLNEEEYLNYKNMGIEYQTI